MVILIGKCFWILVSYYQILNPSFDLNFGLKIV
jgi:hypothetical protein